MSYVIPASCIELDFSRAEFRSVASYDVIHCPGAEPHPPVTPLTASPEFSFSYPEALGGAPKVLRGTKLKVETSFAEVAGFKSKPDYTGSGKSM